MLNPINQDNKGPNFKIRDEQGNITTDTKEFPTLDSEQIKYIELVILVRLNT